MAKELPYFKFEPNQWENGNIQMFSREEKGLFIDLCSMYWSRLGDLPFKLAIQKLCNGNATAFNSLIEEQIFLVKDGAVCIDFLNEQLLEFENTSQQNSKNAKDRWEKYRKDKAECERNATASISQCESNAIREDEIREDKRKGNEIREKKIKEDNFMYEEIIEIFNSVCYDLPNVEKITDSRKKAIEKIIKEYSLEKIGDVFKKSNESDFLSGRKSDWKANFDWILIPKNFVKILEDNYKNLNNGQQSRDKSDSDHKQSAVNAVNALFGIK